MGALVKAEQQADAADHRQYLTFVLGGEMYAIAILSVKEIIDYGHLTVVPMMPDCIRGVINLRGAVVPVVDLARRFSSGSTEVKRRSCIVIIEVEADGEHQDIGVIVDAVSEVLEIRQDQIEPPPAFGAKIRTDFIQGMGKVDGRFVIVLNVNRVLSMEDLAMLGRAAGQDLAAQEAGA
ncbi:MAG TPA: chemotaxis protein CheW [Rhodocyclaceae bacterium]|nr:chemotaxis protein CheW [Rhodocyclaceae bacterium]